MRSMAPTTDAGVSERKVMRDIIVLKLGVCGRNGTLVKTKEGEIMPIYTYGIYFYDEIEASNKRKAEEAIDKLIRKGDLDFNIEVKEVLRKRTGEDPGGMET